MVDDYAPMADHLTKVLCDKEYEAVAVYSGGNAVRVAEQIKPHALIADIMMPGMSGVELACAFAEKFPDCHAVLMTANHWAKELFIGGLRIKVFEKPLNLAELFQFLASAAPDAVGSPS